MHGSYRYEGLAQGEGSNRNYDCLCEVFWQYIFVCVCIHLVPSCNSLLMFVSNFSVYLIIILIYLFTFLFIHLLIRISLLICLSIIYL